MTAKELFALAPYGATVRYSDGTPQPPARFTKKMREWKRNNGSGFFVRAEKSRYDFSSDNFTLQTCSGEVVVVNQSFSVDSNKDFVVEPIAAGTVIAYSSFEGRIEVKYVFADTDVAVAWAVRNKYDLFNCGLHYWIVDDNGQRVSWVS